MLPAYLSIIISSQNLNEIKDNQEFSSGDGGELHYKRYSINTLHSLFLLATQSQPSRGCIAKAPGR